MSNLIRQNWPWQLLAFLLGAVITWLLLTRRSQPAPAPAEQPAEEKVLATVGGPALREAYSPETQTAGGRAGGKAAREAHTAEGPVGGETAHEARSAEPRTAETGSAEPVAQPTPAHPAGDGREPFTPADPPARAAQPAAPAFSQRMEAPILFDETVELAAIDGEPADGVPAGAADEVLAEGAVQDVPAGRFGPGSADAVAHQGPPDGFTIKGNAQSMLFHTPDSPYYGRTKPEVWFRTEADAENAGFTKYARKPRRSPSTR